MNLLRAAIDDRWDDFVNLAKTTTFYNAYDISIAFNRFDVILRIFDECSVDPTVNNTYNFTRSAITAKHICAIAVENSKDHISDEEARQRLDSLHDDGDIGKKINEMCINQVILEWINSKGWKHNIPNDQIEWLNQDNGNILYPGFAFWFKPNHLYNENWIYNERVKGNNINVHSRTHLQQLYTYNDVWQFIHRLQDLVVRQNCVEQILYSLTSIAYPHPDVLHWIDRILNEYPETRSILSLRYTPHIILEHITDRIDLTRYKRDVTHWNDTATIIIRHGLMTKEEILDCIYQNYWKNHKKSYGPLTYYQMRRILG